MFFAKPLQRSNLCASHRQRRWLTHGELDTLCVTVASSGCGAGWSGRADRTVMGRSCGRPLSGHGPSGQRATE